MSRCLDLYDALIVKQKGKKCDIDSTSATTNLFWIHFRLLGKPAVLITILSMIL